MAEGNASEGFTKPRRVLGDLTNLLGKRDHSQAETIGAKSSKFNSKDSAKRIRVASPAQSEIHYPKDNILSIIPNSINKNTHATMNKLQCQVISKISSDLVADVSNDVLPIVNLVDFKTFGGRNLTDLKGKRVMSSSAIEETEIPESGQSEFFILEGNEKELKINEDSKVDLGSLKEPAKVVGNICVNTDDELSEASEEATDTGGYGLDNDSAFDDFESKGSQSDANEYHQHHDGDGHTLSLSQCGSVNCVNFLPDSQESTVFRVEKFMEVKNANEKCVSEGTRLIGTCSCSFCTKAGFMWLDLNCQDIKARVSALKKSQKEASILAERIIRSKCVERGSSENGIGSSSLDSDLMYHSVSLFQHMAGVMEQESNQLESRLLPLNDLREKCKRELESEKQ